MSTPSSFILIGGGGHARVLADTLAVLGHSVLGFTDQHPSPAMESALRLPCLGNDDAVSKHRPDEVLLVNAIGSAGDLGPRRAIFERFKSHGYCFATLIHPFAYVSSRAEVHEGAQIMAGAVVQPGATIGMNSIVNTNASVDHDCRIGAHVHLAPGTTLSGNVAIGAGTHLGTGTRVIEKITIGDHCLVAAGSVVIRDLPDGARVAGVPTRTLRSRS